mgnify:CR=1 FL=1
MGVLGHLTKEERESLWETFEKKLKTGTPVLIGVLNKKFLQYLLEHQYPLHNKVKIDMKHL